MDVAFTNLLRKKIKASLWIQSDEIKINRAVISIANCYRYLVHHTSIGTIKQNTPKIRLKNTIFLLA